MFERILLASMLALFLYGCGGSDNEGETFPEPSPGPYIPDDDKDGLNDEEDSCLGTPEDEINAIDENGCSAPQLDGDSDGVINRTDLCPDTAENAVVDDDGCSAVQRDTDMDGVDDSIDICPTTPADLEVDAVGCADPERDDDGDSVLNAVDECPSTAAGATVDAVGCADAQLDSDEDGVNDAIDVCPATEADAEVDAVGCSQPQQDADGDTVANSVDTCPATPAGEKSDQLGCASSQKDSDTDGVVDSVDICEQTVAEADVDASGCSAAQLDTDGDSVANTLDRCPDTPSGMTVDGDGCTDAQLVNVEIPVMRTSGRNILDSTGQPFTMRGINLQYGDNPGVRLAGIAPIADVGSNIVRLQLRDNTTAGELRRALDAIIDRDMVAMVLLWEPEGRITCTSESEYLFEAVETRWLGDWLSVLSSPKYQPYLMINIANEWGPLNVFQEDTTAYNGYIAIYESIIAMFRDEGVLAPLVIDAPHCGQDWNGFRQGRGQALIDADPETNVILSLHAYNFLYNTKEEVDEAIDFMNGAGFPWIFGEYGDSNFQGPQAVDHLYLMNRSEEEDIGWIAWSWKGNSTDGGQDVLDMSTSESEIELTQHGEDIVNGSFGLMDVAVLADFVPVGAPPTFAATGAEATQEGDILVNGDSADLRDAGGDPKPALIWNFSIPSDGTYVVSIEYTSDNNDRQQNIVVDEGDEEVRTFPIDGSPSQSNHVFTAGDHSFEINANWGYMTIHSIEIRPYSQTFVGTDAVTAGDVTTNDTSIQLRDAGGDPKPAATWTFNVARTGAYVVNLDYTSDNNDRAQNIIFNEGDTEVRTFPIDGSPSTSIETLTAGENTLKVEANWGYMDLHGLEIFDALSTTLAGTDAVLTGDVTMDGTTVQLRDAGGDPRPAVTWTFTIPFDGKYKLSLSYVSDSNDRQQNVVIDGGDATVITFPISDDPVEIIQTFDEGEHTLEVNANWGWMTLNSLTISSVE